MGIHEGPQNLSTKPVTIIKTLFIIAMFFSALMLGYSAAHAEELTATTFPLDSEAQTPRIADGPDIVGVCLPPTCETCSFPVLEKCRSKCERYAGAVGEHLMAITCEQTEEPMNYVEQSPGIQTNTNCTCTTIGAIGQAASPWIDGF